MSKKTFLVEESGDSKVKGLDKKSKKPIKSSNKPDQDDNVENDLKRTRKIKRKKEIKSDETVDDSAMDDANSRHSKNHQVNNDDEDEDDDDGSEESDFLPVEPEAISRKDRRKRRKLQSQGNLEFDEGQQDQSSSKIKTTATDSRVAAKSNQVESIFTTNKRTQFGVWVGNMLFTTQGQELHEFFKDCGKITRINMPTGRKDHENNRGFAYVDFETDDGQEKALKMTESPLAGRKLLIKRSNDYTGRPKPEISADELKDGSNTFDSNSSNSRPIHLNQASKKILDRQKQSPAPCLYIGNLGFEATEEKIQTMFEINFKKTSKADTDSKELVKDLKDHSDDSDQVGIRKVRMGTFEDSGKCKGFAFVDFKTAKQATDALLNTRNYTLDGRRLVLEFASPEAVRRGGGILTKTQRHSNPSFKRGGENYSILRQNNRRVARSDQNCGNDHRSYKADNFSERSQVDDGGKGFEAVNRVDPKVDGALKKDLSEEKIVRNSFKGRQTPGAALANAKRASTGIVKNPTVKGTKIVFD
ncbi:hypothetical protein BY996DRAFT_6413463 [Phakopsora pachyrhizi]|nr:hypothetical protein BY996DRAFT_6413463 [Phakopsora pachyrhizi]